jgi:repressor LexA
MPTNPAYEPLYFTNDEILEKPVKVIGKVIENRQKY